MANVKYINGSLDPNLNGTNFTNDPSSTLFSFASFNLTSNFDKTVVIDYQKTLTGFSIPITMETIGLTESQSDILHNKTNNVILNLDKTNLNTFVKFGSAYEFLRNCVQNIILTFPGDLYVNSQKITGGNTTFNSFNYNPLTDESIMHIPSAYIDNVFGMVFNYGNVGTPDNNELKNINLSYDKYVVWSTYAPDDNSHNIIGFTGDTSSRSYVIVKTQGNPFSFLPAGTTTAKFNFNIKPNNLILEEFRAKLTDYEKYMVSNRVDSDGFKFILKEPNLLDDGNIEFSNTELFWKTSDGYAIDISTSSYQRFLDSLLTIGTKYDAVKTDLISRFLSPSSIKIYDLTEEGKMTKLLRIYGEEFDKIKQFIDSLVYINKVTYNKKNNIPDQLVGNLAKTLGWNYFSLVTEEELMTKFLSVDDNERNLHTDLLPAEVDIELWRRILINTNYFWKSKGTRDAIKAIFLLIGIPEPFVEITEHVYTVEGKIDPRQAKFTAVDYPSNSLPYDNSGYPKAPLENNEYYFQVSGNTDSGQAYMNAFRKAGFNLKITPDNKKSWIQSGATMRVHPSTPTYYQEDSQLVLNTKEVNVALDTSRGLEWDVWNYITKIDFPTNSTDYVSPFSFVNISIGLTGATQNIFKLPSNYKSHEGDLEIRFNGILLNAPKTGITATTNVADYSIVGNEFILANGVTARGGNDRDVIQATYLLSGGTITGATIKYCVTRVDATLAGTTIPLPDNTKGDVQVTINGIALTRGSNQFIADYIVDPNNTDKIIIQNPELIAFLAVEPHIQVAYLTVSGSTTITSRNEVTRIDSFNTGKIYYNVSANKYVYKLNYKINKTSDIKVLINGIALEAGTDYSLNSSNPYEIFLPSGLRFGNVISVYYIVGGDEYKNPIISTDLGLGDLSGLSFMEFVELIQRRLINATNRLTITDFKGGWYPTLLKIYITYLRRGLLSTTDPLYSNAYTFMNLYPFLSKYNAFFQRFIDQLLPATIIVRKGGLLIRNSIFTRQKFAYKRGVYMGHIDHLGLAVDPTTYNVDNELFYFGNDGSYFYKRQESKNIDWSGDYVCVDNICSLIVGDVNITYPTTTTTTTLSPFCTTLQLNTTDFSEIISTPLQEGNYSKSSTLYNFIPQIIPGQTIVTKINFTTLLTVGDLVNTGGTATAIINVKKNGVSIYTTTHIQTGYNAGVTYTDTTPNITATNGDIIEIIIENESVENVNGVILSWDISSTTTCNVEVVSGCVYDIIPPSVDNIAVSSSTPTPATSCSVFIIDNNKKVYTFDPLTNTTIYRFTESIVTPDIASTNTKMWFGCQFPNQIIEYDITLDPFTVSPSYRVITCVNFTGSGLGVKDDHTLIGTSGSNVYLYDVTGGAAVETLLFSMGANRSTVGDILYNSYTDTYIISNVYNVFPITNYHITEYQSDGTILTDIPITESNIFGLYQYGIDLYAIRGLGNSFIYKITPTGLVFENVIGGTNVFGASQDVSCITANLTP